MPNTDAASDPYVKLFSTAAFTGADTLRLGDLDGFGQATYTMPPTATRVAIAFTILDRSTTQNHYAGVWYNQRCNDNTCRNALFASCARDVTGDEFLNLKEQDDPSGDRYSPDLHDPRDEDTLHALFRLYKKANELYALDATRGSVSASTMSTAALVRLCQR